MDILHDFFIIASLATPSASNEITYLPTHQHLTKFLAPLFSSFEVSIQKKIFSSCSWILQNRFLELCFMYSCIKQDHFCQLMPFGIANDYHVNYTDSKPHSLQVFFFQNESLYSFSLIKVFERKMDLLHISNSIFKRTILWMET